MAWLWSRKRSARSEQAPAEGSAESVRLDTAEHAWWVQEEVKEAWRPKSGHAAEVAPEPDLLAEHFGDDWRTDFLYTATPGEPEGEAPDALDPCEVLDPYEVLDVEPTATWDEIIAAHRHQARVNHPDLSFGQSEAEKAAGEERIRIINAAYKELRIRRGR